MSSGLEIALETTIEDAEFSRGVGLPNTKVLATFFKLPENSGLIETFQYVNPPGQADTCECQGKRWRMATYLFPGEPTSRKPRKNWRAKASSSYLHL